jgi:hypothetical protein
MRYLKGVVGIGVALAGVIFSSPAIADPPDFLRHYRFLPRLSTLNQQGGIGGWDTDFAIGGSFDFVTGYEYDLPQILAYASFENVDAWASHPVLAYVLPLDETLNLSELKGELLPLAAPFDVYRFEGETSDRSSVTVHAALLGRWIVMRGRTTAPEGSADYFEYTLQSIARQAPSADFNLDEWIDHLDLQMWQRDFGGKLGADADFNGVVDGGDFLELQRQMGADSPPSGLIDGFDRLLAESALAPAAGAVPEPGAISIAAMVVGIIAVRRLRRYLRS